MISTPSTRGRNPCECFQKARSEISPQRSSLPLPPQRHHSQHQNGGGGGASRPAPRGRRALPLSGRCRQNGGGGGKYERAVSFPALRGKPGGAMDVSGCMKSLLLAATQYKAAKTPCNAALVQRSLEVRMAPGLQAAGERRRSGAARAEGSAVGFPWGRGAGRLLSHRHGAGQRLAPLRRDRLGLCGHRGLGRPGPAAAPGVRRGRGRGKPPGARFPVPREKKRFSV